MVLGILDNIDIIFPMDRLIKLNDRIFNQIAFSANLGYNSLIKNKWTDWSSDQHLFEDTEFKWDNYNNIEKTDNNNFFKWEFNDTTRDNHDNDVFTSKWVIKNKKECFEDVRNIDASKFVKSQLRYK